MIVTAVVFHLTAVK